MKAIQKVQSFTLESQKQDRFSLFSHVVPIDIINAVGPTILKHWNPATYEGVIAVLQKYI